MKLLNYGSLNYDFVYRVDHMVTPGETLSAGQLDTNCGGKGLNQSIALARAGVPIYHAGMVGEDGDELLAICKQNGIDNGLIRRMPGKSGHAVIQVNPEGENSILLFEGANGGNTTEQVAEVLSQFTEGDILLLQNEVNLLDEMIDLAYERGLRIVLNPSPYNERVERADLRKISLFIMNEIEGIQMTGEDTPDKILDVMASRYPGSRVVLTLGKGGSIYSDENLRCQCPGFSVKAIDTTAAGDTFTGYYLASWTGGREPMTSLRYASAAAALAVTRPGAVVSIPKAEETEAFLFAQL